MFQALKALIEIITTSFGTKSLRCTRAAFWLCVFVSLVLGIVAVTIAVVTMIYVNQKLGEGLMFIVFFYVCLASIWLTVLTARRIRDIGYKALYFYLYAIITGISGSLSNSGDLNLDELDGLLSVILGIVIFIIHIWILILCTKPTSPMAEERFGAAIVYSFDMEKMLFDLKNSWLLELYLVQ